MFTLLSFALGTAIGVIYEKQLRKYKDRIQAAAKAATNELHRP